MTLGAVRSGMRYQPSNLAIARSLGLLTIATKTSDVGCISESPLSNPHISIEFFDQCINLRDLFLDITPIIRFIPLGLYLVISFPLLLYPGVILQVMNALTICISHLEHMISRFTQ